jgi:hypothetical protein
MEGLKSIWTLLGNIYSTDKLRVAFASNNLSYNVRRKWHGKTKLNPKAAESWDTFLSHNTYASKKPSKHCRL